MNEIKIQHINGVSTNIPLDFPNQDELILFVSKFVSSIKNKNLDQFKSIHKTNDSFFLVEQLRWFDRITTPNDSYTYKISDIKILKKKSQIHMNVSLSISSNYVPEKIIDGIYSLISDGSRFYIHNLSLMTLNNEDLYNVHYSKSMRKEAETLRFFIANTYRFYEKYLNRIYPLDILNILLFNSSNSLAFTIPVHSAYGWFEIDESIKISIPDFIEDRSEFLSKILLHEMTHLFLTNSSNNNLSLCFQEGFSMYIEQNHEIILGKKFNFCSLEDYAEQVSFSKNMLINGEKSILPLINLVNLSENDGTELYHQGFLWTLYLIEKYGIEYFLEFVLSLKQFKKMNDSTSKNSELVNQRTLEKIHVFYNEEIKSTSNILRFYS